MSHYLPVPLNTLKEALGVILLQAVNKEKMTTELCRVPRNESFCALMSSQPNPLAEGAGWDRHLRGWTNPAWSFRHFELRLETTLVRGKHFRKVPQTDRNSQDALKG